MDFSYLGDYFCSGGSDNIVMVWKSNFTDTGNEAKDVGKKGKVVEEPV